MNDLDSSYRRFFAESPGAVLVVLPDSPRFTVVAVTKACLSATNLSEQQTVGRGLFELAPSAAGLRASLERVLQTKAADGTAGWLNTPLSSATGEVTYILHRLLDSGEAAGRERDVFSHAVAHELRGPLRSINGFGEILLQEHAADLNDEGRRFLGIMRHSAQRLSHLIEDLLRFSTIGREPPRRIAFDLSSVVRTVAAQIRAGEPGRAVVLEVMDAVQVTADPLLLQVVLDNLLRNAWKFTSLRGDARIEFGCEDASGEVCYFIRDNGAGFDTAHASRLFGVFQRLHPEGEFPGSGLGLATVKRIVESHGGRVWTAAAVDRGATFYFTLGPAAAVPTAGQSSAVAWAAWSG
jgi:signal transduction histidine kinase